LLFSCKSTPNTNISQDEAYKQAVKTRNRKLRFDKIWSLSKSRHICEADPAEDPDAPAKPDKMVYKHGGCGNVQPEMRKAGLQLFATFKPKKSDDDDIPGGAQPEKKRFFADDALAVFRLITDETMETLGLNADYARPEWMILQSLPVPPPPVRPSISVDGSGQGQRGEDDLTFKLGDIVRANQAVGRTKEDGTPDHIRVDLIDLLQYHIATYMDNDIAGLDRAQHKSGRAIKSIRARLKGKEGRLRQNLMGKRVDFSARTVITGDPNLSLDEVGVPRSIARTLTFPEKVTRFNIEKLKSFVANGPQEHPGARYVIRDTGERIDLRIGKAREIALQYGWTVERHIQDGDVILFNRQPSLHKESMMAHRVRVMPYSTFRLNLSVTTPYNADFDGDEMNLHVPQSEESRSELRHLCMVPLNIVSPQKNAPLMGIIQDTLCGIYKICDKDVFLSKDAVMNVMMWVPEWDGVIPQPAILKPSPRWTGKQMISMIIPKGLNLHRPAKTLIPEADQGVWVSEGELMFGLFNKKIVGAAAGGVIHITFNEWGPDAAMAFFNGAQTVVNYWLLHNGFSVGIGDTIPSDDVVLKVREAIEVEKAEVDKLIASAQAETLEPQPGMNIRKTFESRVMNHLNSARDHAGTYMEQQLKDSNGAVQMARSGSKGNNINIAQMMAIVGPQSVEGKRVPFGFNYRTLPHFAKDDFSAHSRGFVENSYLRGLTPTEFFFHAMAGREGLIDTAVKTAETGYIQRRLVKALEEATVRYDGTVRDSHGNVIQFLYGEDGLDGAYIEKQSVDVLYLSDAQLRDRFYVDVMGDEDPFNGKLLRWKDCTGDLALQELFDEELENITQSREIARSAAHEAEEDFQLPMNVARIISQTAIRYKIRKGSESDLDPHHAITSVNALMAKLVVVRGDDTLSVEAQSNATLLIRSQLRSRLAFKRLIQDFSINRLAFDSIIGQVEKRFNDAVVAPGEMVGVLAAQSIGEPATQMTLNTFHYTGVSAKNVTLGVPRLKEILNVSSNIKTPSMTVYQVPENMMSMPKAKELRSRIQHTNLRSLTETCELWFDPDIESTIIEADKDFVDAYWIIPDEAEADTSSHSRWLLRIVLNRAKMLDKGLTIDQIAAKMKSEYGRDLSILFSDQNADQQVVRIRSVASFGKEEEEERQEDDDLLRRFMNEMLDNLTFNGVAGLPRVYLNTKKKALTMEDGSLKPNAVEEAILETDGSAFAKVLSIEGVDATRTYSNCFTEIHEVLGIEAARAAIYHELKLVLSFDGSYVNARHLGVLCDGMTFRGYVSAISRHGINKSDNGPLMRCSFEQTVEILYEAAVNGELDDCTGVTENIILGQPAPVGTGMMDILLDDKLLSTIVSDNSNLGLGGPIGVKRQQDLITGSATPYDSTSPMHDSGYLGSPEYGASFSPIAEVGAETGGFSEYQPNSGFGGGFSPYGRSPGGYSPASPGGFGSTSPASPAYSPGGAGYSPTSPAFGPTSPNFGATSPSFSPVSPAYNATSPAYSPTSPTSAYSPTSPQYSPTSPNYSPSSPAWSPTSPQYSPTSPQYSPTSPSSPTSPVYSPTSPQYSPTSPVMGGSGKHASPTSPQYSPTSPSFSPTSPVGGGSPTSPQYSPTSPQFSPRSPGYSPTSPKND
jgi:DNA-directed RNA polymerase II subunit RPB1